MERIKALLNNTIYRECIEKNKQWEQDRVFCHHDLDHFFMVARILYQWVLEYQLPFGKETVYAVGLLHDLGRFLEYEKGISHEEASVELAKKILPQCNFTEEECKEIAGAIVGHRGEKNLIQLFNQWNHFLHCANDSMNSVEDRVKLLGDLLYLADKSSRNCSFCERTEECKWSDTKKQLHLLLL